MWYNFGAKLKSTREGSSPAKYLVLFSSRWLFNFLSCSKRDFSKSAWWLGDLTNFAKAGKLPQRQDLTLRGPFFPQKICSSVLWKPCHQGLKQACVGWFYHHQQWQTPWPWWPSSHSSSWKKEPLPLPCPALCWPSTWSPPRKRASSSPNLVLSTCCARLIS